MFDISGVLETLAQHRPIFHSEADFQHALAWEIHRTPPQTELRLEYPVRVRNWFARSHAKFEIDIFVTFPEEKVAIECKYKVEKLNACMGEETFALASQQAHNEGAYDFVLDIMRLEAVIEQGLAHRGIACFLTNEAKYWKPSKREPTNMDAFRLSDDRLLTGSLAWDASRRKNRTEVLELRNKYHLHWQESSKVEGVGAGNFRCLIVEAVPSQK